MNHIKTINKLLVCLDLTDIDSSLIQYASFLSQKLDIEKVIFFHAIQAYDLPDKTHTNFPDLNSSLSSTIQEEIDSVVSHHFKRKKKTEVITKIEDEDAANVILDFIEKEDIDLTLIGQKYGEDREGRYGHKIATTAKSDLMFIPEQPTPSIDKILTAIDFSRDSEKAFKRALDISDKTSAKVSCYYIFDLSKSYFPGSTNRTSSSIKHEFEKKFKKFLKKFDLTPNDIDGDFELNDKLRSMAEKLYIKAKTIDADMAIIGAKGKTSTVTSLLGNVTETLRKMEKSIPIMIIKNQEKKGWLSF